MYCNIEQADSLSSATLEIEVDSAVNWIFALVSSMTTDLFHHSHTHFFQQIEHGVMAFQNKLRQMDDATMLALGSLLAPYSSLKLFYIKVSISVCLSLTPFLISFFYYYYRQLLKKSFLSISNRIGI